MRRGRGRTHRRTSGGLGYDAVRPVRMLRLEQAPALLCSGCRRPGVRTGRDQRSVCGRTRGCWPGRDARGGLIGSSRGRCGRSAGAHEQPCQQRGNGHQGRTRTGQHRWDRHENLPGGARPTTPAPRFAGSTPPGDAASGGSPGGGKRRTRRAADGRCCSGWTRTQPENELRTPAPAALLPGQTPTPRASPPTCAVGPSPSFPARLITSEGVSRRDCAGPEVARALQRPTRRVAGDFPSAIAGGPVASAGPRIEAAGAPGPTHR